MPIASVNPIIVPPQPEKTFPLLWLQDFRTEAGDNFAHVRASATLKPYRTDSGVNEFAPVDPTYWADGNVFTLHVRRPDLDQLVGAVLDAFPAIRAAAPSNTLAILELLAQVIGAVSQAPVVEETPIEPQE